MWSNLSIFSISFFVLTVAHCEEKFEENPNKSLTNYVGAGANNDLESIFKSKLNYRSKYLKQFILLEIVLESDEFFLLEFTKFIKHPQYEVIGNQTINDIALIRVKKRFIFGKTKNFHPSIFIGFNPVIYLQVGLQTSFHRVLFSKIKIF